MGSTISNTTHYLTNDKKKKKQQHIMELNIILQIASDVSLIHNLYTKVKYFMRFLLFFFLLILVRFKFIIH